MVYLLSSMKKKNTFAITRRIHDCILVICLTFLIINRFVMKYCNYRNNRNQLYICLHYEHTFYYTVSMTEVKISEQLFFCLIKMKNGILIFQEFCLFVYYCTTAILCCACKQGVLSTILNSFLRRLLTNYLCSSWVRMYCALHIFLYIDQKDITLSQYLPNHYNMYFSPLYMSVLIVAAPLVKKFLFLLTIILFICPLSIYD